MDQHALGGLPECLGRQFFFQKTGLRLAQIREIVQSVIDPMRIRLVFAAIQHDDARVAPIEGAVGLVAYIVEQAAQADRIGVADFMVSADIEDRDPAGSYRFVQFAEEAGCLVVVGRVVDAIAIENDKVIFQVFHLLAECLQRFGTLVQVVEDDGCKV